MPVAEGLIIVESPAKARTLKRFLGDRFDVLASMGHVRDLPEKEIAVDVEHGFKPHYEVVESRRKTINELKAAVKKYLWAHGVAPGEQRSRAGDQDTAGLVFGEEAEGAAKARA